MQFTHYFWDFDGTLCDSYASITTALQQALATFSVNAPYDELYTACKISLNHALDTFAVPHALDLQAVKLIYRQIEHTLAPTLIVPYQGAQNMLMQITNNKGKNYIYTHRGTGTLDLLKKHDMYTYFADFVTSDDGFAPKPAPDALQFLLKKHALDASKCIMIGDRSIDVQAGLNAGMQSALFDPLNLYPNEPVAYRAKTFDALQKMLLL